MDGTGRLDLVIRGGTVYDGTGRPGTRAVVGVRGDRIVAVGAVVDRGAVELEAAGLAVAPGFIDVHTHDDFAVLLEPAMGFKVLQGVTSDVVGNCGSGVVHGASGAFADLVVLDPARIDVVTYASPRQAPTGIRAVYVDVVAVARDGVHTGARPGRGCVEDARDLNRHVEN